MIEDIDLYIQQLEQKIINLKQKRRTTLYEISIDFGSNRNQYCDIIKKHFQKNGYSVDIQYCQQCGGRYADIIISFNL